MNFLVGHSDVSYAVRVNSRLPDGSNGGAFTLTSTYPFYGDNTAYTINTAISKDPSSSC